MSTDDAAHFIWDISHLAQLIMLLESAATLHSPLCFPQVLHCYLGDNLALHAHTDSNTNITHTHTDMVIPVGKPVKACDEVFGR